MSVLNPVEKSLIQHGFSDTVYQCYGPGKMFLHATGSTQAIPQCSIVDLTNLSRVGFRGVDSAETLKNLGFELPEKPNMAVWQQDGSYVARLSATEYLLLGALNDFGERIQQIEKNWCMTEHSHYLLPRQDSHSWIALTGKYISLVMAKLCGVDLSTEVFSVGQIAQTSVARINAIVINVSDDQADKFYILSDRAASVYLWEVLLDTMQEFEGQAVGIEGLL
ncbi:sarcosine oxidase subunit gamma [Acinetobacter terrae]|uniref:sarcosine oxidase subunit gamma n=1 Tax=Acinetobacter terrae TaxID=2731247 RepID=UPI0007D767DE|nr:sarcosine oxidase [Acinetobacter terrae]OAL86721.1 sarcosine oxidase [Acinetobacter terrae]